MTTHGITDELVGFALRTRWDRLPADVREAASTTAGNVLALALGASGSPVVERALGALAPLGPGEGGAMVGVLGRTERLTPLWAALVHGVAAHVEDFDDTHLATVVHPGAAVVPAALAGAQIADGGGEDVLIATAVGTEVALRLGLALTPHAMERGWHMTGVVGTVGAAVAAGRAMGLDHDQLRHAIGFAATQSAGLLEALGTMAKPLHPGKAASAGVEAALLARAGLDGPAAPLEGRRGLLALMRPGLDLAEHAAQDARTLLEGLGTTWELNANEIKPYACGVVSHPVIDLARALRGELAEGEVPVEVRLDVHPLVPSVMGRTDPRSGLEAKFSAVHCFAVGLLRDGGGPGDFTDAAAADPALARVRERCVLVPDPGLGRYTVRARVETDSGRVVERSVDGARRMSSQEVRDKALALTYPLLGRNNGHFVDTAFGLEEVTDLAALTGAGRPAPALR